MTIEDVAKYLRVSERTIYDWAQKGILPGGKIGTTWRFKSADIQRWVNDKLNNDSDIKLSIYNLNGKLIKEINKCRTRGLNELRWNGRNEMDQEISSGVYLYILNADGKTSSNKLIFLK